VNWRKPLSDCLMATACLLLAAILAFVSIVGPRTGWSKSAKTDTGKSYYSISADAPAAVHIASIGALIAFPLCLIGYILARPREPDR
jgi:hypothetical protein